MYKPIPFQKGDKINLNSLKSQIDRRILKITHMICNPSSKPVQKKCSDKCCQLSDTFTQTQPQYTKEYVPLSKNRGYGPLEQITQNQIYDNKRSNCSEIVIASPIGHKKGIPKPQKNNRSSFPKRQDKQNAQNQQSLYQQLSFKKSPDRIKISMIVNSLPQTQQETQIQSPSVSKDFMLLNHSIQNTSILGSNDGEQQFMCKRQDYEQIQDDKFFSNCEVFSQLFQKASGVEPLCAITKNNYSQTQSAVKKSKSIAKMKVSKLSGNKYDLDLSSIQRQSNKRKRTNSIYQNCKQQRKPNNLAQSFDKIIISNECKQKMKKKFMQNSQKVRRQCKGNNIRVSLLRRIQQKYLKGKQRVDQY